MFHLMKVMFLPFALIFTVSAQSADNDKQKKIELEIFEHLKKTTEVYSSDTGLHSKFRRRQILSLLGETDTSRGELFYSKKRLRLNFDGNEKSMVLITPGEIWNVTYEGDKPSNIIKSKPMPMPLLDLLFGDKNVWDKFEIHTVHLNNDGRLDVTLKPKSGSQISYVSRVRFDLNKKKNIVRKLTYWDDLDNETTMTFTFNKFKDKIDESLFKFTPPPEATVTVM